MAEDSDWSNFTPEHLSYILGGKIDYITEEDFKIDTSNNVNSKRISKDKLPTISGYALSRKWFDFAFETTECKVHHTALFMWIVELNNRLGWKKEFGLPTCDTMEGLSIGNKTTYYLVLRDIAKWGFIQILQESKNQHQSTVITVCCGENALAPYTALDTALIQHCSSTVPGTVPIDKQVNKETKNTLFESFWKIYDKKTGKAEAFRKWDKLSPIDHSKILEVIIYYVRSTPDEKFRKNPLTYLNGRHWEDEILSSKQAPVSHISTFKNDPDQWLRK